jgi:putative hydrolase of the HAD superfamily
MTRFDAVLFDAGGVLVLPDPTVLAPLLAPYGGSIDIGRHRRAHYIGMAAKSWAGSAEGNWSEYNKAYVDSVGVGAEFLEHAIHLLDQTRTALLWRWPVPETVSALRQLSAMRVPMGVVSNASGQVEAELRRTGICQVGPGEGSEMRVVIDSHVVGVAKPDPHIFDFALPHFSEFDPSRIVYVGDSVAMDIVASAAAGLHPVLVDPFGDHPDLDFERIVSVGDIVGWFDTSI